MSEETTDLTPSTDAFDEADAEAMGDYADVSGDLLADDTQEDNSGEGGDEQKAGSKAEAEAEGATEQEDEQSKEDEPDAGASTHVAQHPALQINTDADPGDIGRRISELDTQYDDGDIDSAEYRDQRDALLTEKIKAETYREINEQSADRSWEQAQADFFSGDNARYADPGNIALRAAFAGALGEIYKDQSNLGKQNDWYLNEAKRLVDSAFGVRPPEPAQETDEQRIARELAKRKAPDAPSTLSGLPSAGAADPGHDGFADIDKLTGTDGEDRVAAMSPAELDRYLAA